MARRASFCKHSFLFNFQARTSRGVMRERVCWFVKIWDDQNPDVFGIGECAPLPGLSIDDVPNYEDILRECLAKLLKAGEIKFIEGIPDVAPFVPRNFPSIRFGIETALLDLQNGGQRQLFSNDFNKGSRIPINGLIWMADMDLMLQQIAIKVYDGYRCIKMKVGSLNFEKECDILHYIRKKYYREEIVIRLDANGAFKPDDCLYKLKELSKFGVHSIEQPIKTGQRDILRTISEQSPIPIALDEELIGLDSELEMEKLLTETNVPFIILKPSLHGGMHTSRRWIQLAEKHNTGWWITSALESNVGLNAICQLTAQYPVSIPQGLGTGQLYDNNIPSPLQVKDGTIGLAKGEWEFDALLFEEIQ